MTAIRRYEKMLHALMRNTLWRTGADMVSRLGSAVFWILVARYLGAGVFGAIAFTLSLFSFFELISTLGLGSPVTRDAAQNRARAGLYFTHALIIGLAATAITAVLMLLCIHWLSPGSMSRWSAQVMVLVLIPASFGYWSKVMLTAVEEIRYIGLATLIENAVLIAGGFTCLLTGHGLRALIAIIAASKIIAAAVSFLLACRRAGAPVLRFEPALLVSLLKQTPSFFLIALFNSAFWSITVIVLTSLQGEETAGYFSAAYKLISYAIMLVLAFAQALLPVASRLAQDDPVTCHALLKRALRYQLMAFTGLAVIFALSAETIILWLYGSAMAPAAPVLRWLAWILIPYSIIPTLAFTLISHHQQRLDLWANAAATMALVAGIALLVPEQSATGAAVAMTLAAVVFATVEYLSVHHRLYRLVPDRHTVWTGVAAGLMALCLWLMSSIDAVLAILASGFVYGAALWFTQALDRRDLRRLLSVWLPAEEKGVA